MQGLIGILAEAEVPFKLSARVQPKRYLRYFHQALASL